VLQTLTLILACQLAGELAVRALGLPVPGPVLGMLLLLGWLFLRGGVSDDLDRTTSALLEHLSLLFVPAGVGVMVHWESIRQGWQALTLALVASTLIALAATALTMLGVQRLKRRRRNGVDG
jgi:holin-like protein